MKSLGKYQILEELGAGGMGVVYRALDTLLDREVALKAVRAASSADPELKERFYREARACARLQHPHIVTVFELGELDNVTYIAMELLKGADLGRIISAKTPLALEARLELMTQVCEGLAHAHRSGTVHRDIKPANVFVQQDGQAKILDFGIARVTASKLTRVGVALGTPEYMAPEQILGKVCDGRSDLFSAAIVLYELVTHVHPFRGSHAGHRILREDPEPLCTVDPRLPESLEREVLKALQKDPANRHATCDEFAAALREVKQQVVRQAEATYQKASQLRSNLLASRAELGDFAVCRKIAGLLGEATADLSLPGDGPQAGYLEIDAWLLSLQQHGRQLEKLLPLVRETQESIEQARKMFEFGNLPGCSQILEMVEADFRDHPLVRALRQQLVSAGHRSPRGPDTAAPTALPPPAPTELLAKLRRAVQQGDAQAAQELAAQLRSCSQATEPPPPVRETLLAADFLAGQTQVLARLQEGNAAGAKDALRALEALPLEDAAQLEEREQLGRRVRQFASVRDEDYEERRMAEFLALLEGFESALERGETQFARPALGRMTGLAEVDDRFLVAVNECGKRLAELESRAPTPRLTPATQPAALASQPAPPSPTPKQPAVEPEIRPATPDRPETQTTGDPVSLDATLLFSGGQPSPSPPARATPAAGLQPSRSSLAGPGTVPAAPQRPTPMPKAPPVQPGSLKPRPAVAPALGPPSRRKWVLAGGIALALAAAGLMFLKLRPRPIPVEPAVAQAEVVSGDTRLLEAPDAAAKALFGPFANGDLLNVLRLPDSPEQRWVEVQYVKNELRSPRGYVQAEALGNWSAEKPDASLALLKLFRPAESAPELEIERHLAKLAAFVERHGTTAQGPEANLDRARMNLWLARRAQQAGHPPEQWQLFLDNATGQIATTGAGPGLGPQADQLRQQVQALRAQPPPPTTEAAPPPLSPEQRFRSAETAWKRLDFREAVRLLDRLLREQPSFPGARELREKAILALQLSEGRR